MRYSEIICEAVTDPLETLLAFLTSIAAGEKPNNPPKSVYQNRYSLTSHSLKLLGTSIESGWLVHFTEVPDAIMGTGFHGGRDHRLIGRTRGIKLDYGKDGYNYAYPVPSKEASYESSRVPTSGMDPYGDTALFFKARYIRVYDRGDKQAQAVFLGREANMAEVIRVVRESNWERYEANARYDRRWNDPTYSKEERERDIKLIKQPANFWVIENGPLKGFKGPWAKVVAKVVA